MTKIDSFTVICEESIEFTNCIWTQNISGHLVKIQNKNNIKIKLSGNFESLIFLGIGEKYIIEPQTLFVSKDIQKKYIKKINDFFIYRANIQCYFMDGKFGKNGELIFQSVNSIF